MIIWASGVFGIKKIRMETIVTTKGGIRYRVPQFQKVIITATGGIVKIEKVTEAAIRQVFDAMKVNAIEYMKSLNVTEVTDEESASSEIIAGIPGPKKK